MSWVYFIQHGTAGAIKIGTTTGNPYARLRALQTGAPEPLRLICAIEGDAALERELHEKFHALRVRADGEWFKPEPALLWFIEGIRYAKREGQPEDDGESEPSVFDAAFCMFAATKICSLRGKPNGRYEIQWLLDELGARGLENAYDVADEYVSQGRGAYVDIWNEVHAPAAPTEGEPH